MKKVLVIAGPTASGKTAFSIRMAKRMHAEIISGDSIQVYRGMDIGSGKVKEDEKQGIPHHLIDILDPDQGYSAADFQKMARDLLDHSDRDMIICGGTGLYLKSCLYDYSFEADSGTATDPELDQYGNEQLYAMLKASDPKQAEKIHVNNRRRLLRSLTILHRTGIPQSELESRQQHEPIYDIWIAGCTMDREVLYDRINRRVEGMIEEGLKNEVDRLLKAGYGFDTPGMKGIGYQEWKQYYQQNASIETVIDDIQKHSRQFAKRQYTWFNHQMPVHWFESVNETDVQRMEDEIMQWREKQ